MARKNKSENNGARGLISMPVDPILRIPDVAVDDKALVERAYNRYTKFSLDRIEWMRRRETYYLNWDDYLSPTRKGLWASSSNLHLPLTEIQCTIMHAMIMQAVFLNYPWFYIDPQDDVDIERIKKIERFMKYVLERYANFNKGIYLAVDDWAWDLVTDGIGIFSRQWKVLSSRFLDVVENNDFKRQQFDLEKLLNDTDEKDFDKAAKKIIASPYKEKFSVRNIFNGPVISAEDPAYVLFKGEVIDATDLNEHRTVIKVCYFDRDTLISFKESEYFDEDCVDEILSHPPDRKGMSDGIWANDRVRRAKDIQTGVNTISPMAEEDNYELLCAYDRVALSGKEDERADRLQYFLHIRSRTLPRWTFLDRISANGKIPLHMAHLYRRPRRAYGRGMVATMYSLNEVNDILINQGIDGGMLANNPMFAYKGDSTFDPDEVRVEPGMGIKTTDPNSDIRFFEWRINPEWSLPFQNVITSYAQQLTSIGPQSAGQVGTNVGALRSTSGVDRLASAASTQQNIIIKRAQICVSEMFEGLYYDSVQRMPQRLKVTVTGADGIPVMKDGQIQKEEFTREEIRARVHFGMYANSQNMNRDQQKQSAMQIAQFLFQKLPIETGVVTPSNVYAAIENVLQSLGTIRPDRFITQPQNMRSIPIEFEMRMIMEGVLPPVGLNDPDHAEKLKVEEPLLDDPQQAIAAFPGLVNPRAMAILKQVVDEHKKYLATQQRPSNIQNPTGSNQSLTAANPGSEQQGEQQPAQQQAQPSPARRAGPPQGARPALNAPQQAPQQGGQNAGR